jgi:AcrR family transcriptional regulator
VTSITTTADTHERPLRADAERNRQRILDAARELFAERGLCVTLNDIAHHAGVGVGTVYRRFPDKSQLIDGLFEQRLAELLGLMEIAIADPDAWNGLTTFLRQALELQAADRGLKDLITGTPDGLERVSRIRERLFPLGAELVRRAHEQGKLRGDIAAQDLPVVQLMLATLIDAARDVEPELWRRYLAIVLRGLSAQPDTMPAIEPGPLALEDVDKVMSALGPTRR